jgi:asparagine synthase (glutamine-hydrolysing)
MSGIFGICQRGALIDKRDVEPMLAALVLPEEVDQEFAAFPSVCLGVARRWPFQQAVAIDGLAIAADAEIYNRKELASLLGDTPGDASQFPLAVLLAHLYRKCGPAFVELLRGAFSIAVWDEKEQRLLLAVDRLGVNSLYWREERGRIFFGARVGAVRAVQGESVEVDRAALMQYLLFSSVPAPLTIYQGTHRILPGHFLLFDGNRVRESSYWDIEYIESNDRDEGRWAEEVREGIRSSVGAYLQEREAESTGAYLSGGTDSSSVVAFMSERFSPVNTFSIFFEEQRYSEIGYARLIAEHFRTKHNELCLRPSDAWDCIPQITRYYDEPFANSSAIGAYLCARMAREKGMTALFAGDGGDELFAGNSRYATDRYFAAYHHIPAWIRHGLVEPVTRAMPQNERAWTLPKRYVRRANIPNPTRMFSYNVFLSEPPTQIFEPDFLEEVPPSSWMDVANGHFNVARAKAELNRLLYLDVKMILADNDLRKVAGTAELAGVRAIFPLLDYKLVELSARIPSRLKLKGMKKRYIFKKAMKGLLPNAILTKRKHGFGVPVALWLSQDKRFDLMVDDLLSDSRTRQRGYFQPAFLDRMRVLSRGPEAHYYGEILWYLVALELWHREHLEASRRSVPVG